MLQSLAVQEHRGIPMSNDSSVDPQGRRAKILVVEDDEEMLRLLDDELKEAGFQVIQAKNGKEAFTQLERTTPDLIVSDFCLPDGGIDFLRELRHRSGTCRILVITALNDNQTRQDVAEQGVDGFLGKPFRMSSLLDSIARLLHK